MNLTDAIPFLISALLLGVCIFVYLYDQRKFKKQMEEDMQEWFETEYKKNIEPTDRRTKRKGGRRTYDKE